MLFALDERKKISSEQEELGFIIKANDFCLQYLQFKLEGVRC